MLRPIRYLALTVLGVFIFTCKAAPPDSSSAIIEVKGYTEPDEDYQKISFANPGVVKVVYVKAGDVVQKGQLLMEQDPGGEIEELNRLEVEAKSDLAVEAAEANRDAKKVAYDRRVGNPQAFSIEETKQAELEYKTAGLQIDKAREDKQQAVFAFKRQQKKVDQLKLLSPSDGIVERIDFHEGEVTTPDPTKPCIAIVKKDILKVHVSISIAQASKLVKDQKVRVRYPDEKESQEASFLYRDPKANPGANLQDVMLSLPNPRGLDAGRPIFVLIDESVQ